jgi:hypothetical protein
MKYQVLLSSNKAQSTSTFKAEQFFFNFVNFSTSRPILNESDETTGWDLKIFLCGSQIITYDICHHFIVICCVILLHMFVVYED